jgi:hypothetical protein
MFIFYQKRENDAKKLDSQLELRHKDDRKGCKFREIPAFRGHITNSPPSPIPSLLTQKQLSDTFRRWLVQNAALLPCLPTNCVWLQQNFSVDIQVKQVFGF